MHEVDLSSYNIHSDLIIENNSSSYIKNSYIKDKIKVDYISLDSNNSLKKKEGDYITISFEDITDTNNFNNVLEILKLELSNILKLTNIKKEDKCLVIGLGNGKSTPDSLGSEVLKQILVTRYLFLLKEASKEYRNVSVLEPNVLGNTGIESKDIILGVVKEIKPNFLIVIDALASSSIDRMQKTIQITNTGIHPGSGIGNNRGEISKETINIPVIAIGVPTVVSSTVIVNDTLNYLTKKISYHKKNINKDKLAFGHTLNYLKEKEDLTKEEKEELLGLIGTLDEEDLKKLIFEVLNPIGYNLIVTTKEIDFIIEKLGKLIGFALNDILHFKENS